MTVMKFPPKTLAFWLCIQIAATGVAPAQLLTHGPIVGGVTVSEAKVFVRTDSAASVTLRYGTDPDLQTYFTSASVTTNESSDFTATIPLTGLAPETMQYLNVLVNGVPQFSAPFSILCHLSRHRGGARLQFCRSL
jgi:phosphodiesterase/alkaline phosphatase D-like protein